MPGRVSARVISKSKPTAGEVITRPRVAHDRWGAVGPTRRIAWKDDEHARRPSPVATRRGARGVAAHASGSGRPGAFRPVRPGAAGAVARVDRPRARRARPVHAGDPRRG